MTIDTYQAKVKSSIWKAIAQSGLPINSIPMDQQNKFVDHLADNLLVTVNELLEDVAKPVTTSKPVVELEEEETIIWEGRPFLSLVENYTLTNERIKIVKGLIGKDIENFELIRVPDNGNWRYFHKRCRSNFSHHYAAQYQRSSGSL